MSEGHNTGIVTQAKRIQFINLATFLVCLALLIANVVIVAMGKAEDAAVKTPLAITNVVVSSLVLVTMAGSFALSVSLKRTIKASRSDARGIRILLLLMWIATAFYLVVYILSNVACIDGVNLGSANAWGICYIVCLCMPALTFIFGCIIYASAKKLA